MSKSSYKYFSPKNIKTLRSYLRQFIYLILSNIIELHINEYDCNLNVYQFMPSGGMREVEFKFNSRPTLPKELQNVCLSVRYNLYFASFQISLIKFYINADK